MSVPTNASASKLESAVRAYLQKKYLEALEANTINTFQDKLTLISGKIDKKLSSGTLTSNQTKLLITIETIVSEFLG
jgi:ribosomal protein S20